jgi:hypothetical protein
MTFAGEVEEAGEVIRDRGGILGPKNNVPVLSKRLRGPRGLLACANESFGSWRCALPLTRRRGIGDPASEDDEELEETRARTEVRGKATGAPDCEGRLTCFTTSLFLGE